MILQNEDNNFLFHPPDNKKGYIITIYIDSKTSWILPWAQQLKTIIDPFHTVFLAHDKTEIQKGDFNFLLGCTKILETDYLSLNKLNLVVHESDLPSGKGWSPVSWQIFEGTNEIPIVLFEAQPEIDSGQIFLKDMLYFDGTELLPEIKKKQGRKTIELILKFLELWPDIKGQSQQGTSSYYPKRNKKDDMLNINKTIVDNFNQLRITDNEKYPAWFEHKGKKYLLKIYTLD